MQLMDSLALGAGHDPGAGQGNREGMRHHVLLSIAAYMRRLETTVDNPPILLPSLSYPSAQGVFLTWHHHTTISGSGSLQGSRAACVRN